MGQDGIEKGYAVSSDSGSHRCEAAGRASLFRALFVRPSRGLRLLAVLFLAMATVSIGGCGGCRKTDQVTKKKKPPKPDFKTGLLRTQPNPLTRAFATAKPGHLTSATLDLTANNFDFHGHLATDPVPLDPLPFSLENERPVDLPKGQKKRSEIFFYVPPGQRRPQIVTRLLTRSTRSRVISDGLPVQPMLAHQYHLLVLADSEDRYQFLTALDSVRFPSGDGEDSSIRLRDAHYRVVAPKIETEIPLSENPLAWTSIAYILWDGIDPQLLTKRQRQAMLDWLHWGGRLIVSGPRSMDALRGSFLEPYLPATGGGVLQLTQESFDELNARWSQEQHGVRPLKLIEEWSGEKLIAATDAPVEVTVADEGRPLVIERRVGRGVVVVTAFGLSQRELVAWDGYDGFVNGCLLRRTARDFPLDFAEKYGTVRVQWLDRKINPRVKNYDPGRTTAVRFFSRDEGVDHTDSRHQIGVSPRDLPADYAPDGFGGSGWSRADGAPFEQADWSVDETARFIGAGAAGWDDFNPVAAAARESLRDASGVDIPDARFVLAMLGIYLVVLVPVNWAFFSAVGRVEWAWIAAPVISLVFAVVVVRQAQLDIGFIRARNDIGVAELHAGHQRAHLTRYTSLYTSLSTDYELSFDDPSAMAQPFPGLADSFGGGGSRTTLTLRRLPKVTLSGFNVSSNSVRYLHSEQMFDLDGTLSCETGEGGEPLAVSNDTGLTIQGAAVVTRDQEDGSYHAAWIGSLPSGTSARLNFQPAKKGFRIERCFREWNGSPVTSLNEFDLNRETEPETEAESTTSETELGTEGDESTPSDMQSTRKRTTSGQLNIGRLISLAVRYCERGEYRLVGWTEDALSGEAIVPKANQFRQVHLVIAHLCYGELPTPTPDVGSRAKLERILTPKLGPEDLLDR